MSRQAVIESGRAEFALKTVNDIVKNQKDAVKKQYKSYARKFPSLVLSNGLAASVAFIMEKRADSSAGKLNGYNLLYDTITQWLKSEKFIESTDSLETHVCSLSSDEYRILTNEVLSLFEWLRRFASGLIEGEDDAG